MANTRDVAKTTDFDFSLSDSEMMMIMMMIVMFALMQSVLVPATTAAQAAAASVQSLQYEGRPDNRQIDVPSNNIVYIDLIHNAPRTPWTWALFENTGPNDVEIGINNPNDRFILASGSNKTVNRLGATERISIIFFYCQPTQTAHVNIAGEY